MFFGDLIGDRMRKHSFKLKGEKSIGLGPLEGSLLGLLSLLLSFTFQMAAQRYDQRRSVLIDETNRIGTAVLRSDLLQKKDREEVRGLFRNYVKARIAYYEAAADKTKIDASIAENLSEMAQKITQPVLLLCGDKDDITKIEAQRLAAALYDDATYVEMIGTGHLPHYERVEVVAQHTIEFIKLHQ